MVCSSLDKGPAEMEEKGEEMFEVDILQALDTIESRLTHRGSVLDDLGQLCT